MSIPTGWHIQRHLGEYDTGRDGPTLILIGGIHGNEPSGVQAIARVFEWLEREKPPVSGRVVAFAGNVKALAQNERFIVRDLNRSWDEDRVERLRTTDPAADDPEDAEVRELLGLIEGCIERARGPVILIDLHTTSGDGPPFTVMSDTLRNRPIAFAMPVPVILGLEESVDGTLIEYMVELGHVAMGVETGRHDDPKSVDRHESVIWLALRSGGLLKPEHGPDFDGHQARLAESTAGVPAAVELMYRHAVTPEDAFKMVPGFAGFMPVSKGQTLAHDRNGPVPAPRDGQILMPLYQAQGSDGFFVTRATPPWWLVASQRARLNGLERLLQTYPQVQRHPDLTDALQVAPDAVNGPLVEFFHLLGYRKRRQVGDLLVFSRRRHH